MKVSVCITTLNEENSIDKLLVSLLKQTIAPDQIIIVDGGSTDKTIDKIKKFKNKIKLLCYKDLSIAAGRNIAVKNSKNEIIAMTDAGCVPQDNWLKELTKHFKDKDTKVVAGFYSMTTKSIFQKSLANYLGVIPSRFDNIFLPSTRSIAFRKSLWKKIGEFNEKLTSTAEDTDFNYKLALNQVQIVREKNAVVEWGIPENLWQAYKKFFLYARGDAQTGILWNPSKGFKSHNIKAFLIILRYYIGFVFLGLSLNNTSLLPIFIFFIFCYLFWAYKKTNIWGVAIQIISDVAVMSGFISGILGL